MCRRVQCHECGRPTYAGCGAHVEQVLAAVPPSERCRCTGDVRAGRAPRPRPSWLRRLVRRV